MATGKCTRIIVVNGFIDSEKTYLYEQNARIKTIDVDLEIQNLIKPKQKN